MTPQEMFDKVWDHFIVKKSPYSVTSWGVVPSPWR